MIQNLCNLVDDSNLDSFYKILIAEASRLPKFDHLDSKEDVLSIMNNLPDSFQAMVVPFMPRKFSFSNEGRIRNGNTIYSTSINFPLVPQDANLQALMEEYHNREVVAFPFRRSHAYLYGTQAQPLLFTFSELHATEPTGLKGFTLNMEGDGYGKPFYFAGTESDFPVVQRGLAFELAGSL